MLFLGFLMSRLTKLIKLPNVTAYIIIGVVMGPYILDIIPKSVIAGADFLADIALALISFCIGEYFKFSSFRKNGIKALVIALFESMAASILIFILTFVILRLDMAFSIVLSALAAVTAPTSTMMTIRQMRAKGDFVDSLLQVIAIDDIIGLLAFSISVSIAISFSGMAESVSFFDSIFIPILKNLLMIVVGCVSAFLLLLLMPPGKQSSDNRLIISLSVLFLFCGVCVLFDVSPLLGCMAMGTVYRNASGDENLFKQLNYFSPPIMLLFFVRSGLNFDLASLFSPGGSSVGMPLIVISVLYFAVRIVGKYFGAFFGCFVTKKNKSTRNYLGLALIPQAGVAIGLAALCSRSLEGELGQNIQTVIVAAGILYELVGPVCAKLALFKAGAYSTDLDKITDVSPVTEDGKAKSQIDILIEQLQQIHEEVSKDNHRQAENELAFTKAAEEQEYYETFEMINRGRFLNRR